MDRFVATTSSFTRSSGGVHVQLIIGRFALDRLRGSTAWLGSGALPPELRKAGVQRKYTILSVQSNGDNLDVSLPEYQPREAPRAFSCSRSRCCRSRRAR